jgi:predicted RecB family nuclease
MQRTPAGLVFSPSDLNHFTECEHLTTLDLLATEGLGVSKEKDPQAEIIRAKGFEHERGYLESLRAAGRQVVTIADPDATDWIRDPERTARAMRQGAEVIYQAVFVDGAWRGVADFLLRIDEPSALGPWSYEACDAKLARHPKPYFMLQLAWYTEQLARLQRNLPRRMHVVLGTGETQAFDPRDFLAYYAAVRGRFLRALDQQRPTYPQPVGHCRVCGYAGHCEARRRDDDHLSLVAWMRRDQVARLNAAGVHTVAHLATFDAAAYTGITPPTQERLVRQARLQVAARGAAHRYELLPPEPRRGFGLLPAPSPGDIFFDIEGYPFYEPAGGLEYLWGATSLEAGAWRFRSFEGVDRAGEKRAFEAFIDFVHARLVADPDLHVYHYASYETSAVKRLMFTHGTREAEVDDLLRRGVFVDLFQVVRQAMQISHDRYSLKRVRDFFMTGAGEGAVTEGGESILVFQQFLETGDDGLLASIRTYNEEDCESTRLLRDWLIERKAEAAAQFGVDIPWLAPPAARDTTPPETQEEVRALRDRLEQAAREAGARECAREGGAREAAASAATASESAAVLRLLAGLVDYHAREAKPEWWAFFDRLKKSLDELREDSEAIAYLSPAPGVEPIPDQKSQIFTFDFPEQEFKLREGSAVCDRIEGRSAGDLVSIDLAGRLRLRRGPKLAAAAPPDALVAAGPVPAKPQRESLMRIAEAALAGSSAAGGCGLELLLRRAPRFAWMFPPATIQTDDLTAQRELVRALDHSYLFVQGPPGSGKTYTGARLITALVAAGQRVAVTATSHKAIHNLLDEVVAAGRAEGIAVTGVKKCSDTPDTMYAGEGFENLKGNAACAASQAPIVAGTAWLFARGEMAGQFDYLFVDEAGQVSLADAVAMSPCARNLVLLGDPQQLPHVTKGIHPDGAGASVLEHLLDGAATVPPDRGLFLERSWRMHPDVCAFVSDLSYDGRLQSEPQCARQRIDSALRETALGETALSDAALAATALSEALTGTGLRYLPVEHLGNAQQSEEEAAIIASGVRQLLAGGAFTDRDGHRRALTPADILVVAPYNMQVQLLLRTLPAGVDVGTVDKFQGREAPVVFFSMASSSGDDIPRGLEFLFSRNRLNVAVSRAKALAILVCSPRLLETRCRTVDQMRLVNGLCLFTERADTIVAALA